MKNIQMSSDWLRVALLLSEISRSTTFYWLPQRGMQNKQASVTNVCSRSSCPWSAIDPFFLIKDKQSIIVRLEKGKKGTNLSEEYGVSKQQISDIHKNKETSMKFADILETSERVKQNLHLLKVAHDEQLDKALYIWFIQQRTSGTPISGPLKNL